MIRYIICLAAILGSPLSARDVLDGPSHGKLVHENGEYLFHLDDKRNKARAAQSGLDTFKQWHVIGSELQAPIPNRPAERILIGGVGHYNVGMLRPYSGIPIFIAIGNEQPRLVGVTDGNGRFAIKLEGAIQEKEVYLFFSGDIDIVRRQDKGAGQELSDLPAAGGILVSNGRAVLATDSPSERYRVTLPKSAEQGAP